MQIFKGFTSGGCAQGQYSIASGLLILEALMYSINARVRTTNFAFARFIFTMQSGTANVSPASEREARTGFDYDVMDEMQERGQAHLPNPELPLLLRTPEA